MQPLRELPRARADKPPSPPTERLSAGRQLNAIFALALLAAPSVRGCPMKADIVRNRLLIDQDMGPSPPSH